MSRPGPGANTFALRLRGAVAGTAGRGRLHVAAWEPHAARQPFLLAADEQVTAASTIKVPVLAAALGEVNAGRLDLAQPVAIPSPRAGGAGVLHTLPSVSTLSLADLLTLMIIVSDNTATNVVIDLLGLDCVNQFGAEAGLRGTMLRRKMMDTATAGRGRENVTTARDQATLLDAIAWRDLLPAPLRDFALQALERQQSADGLPALLPAGAVVAHKTGELPGIRHDVGIITGPAGRQAVVAALVTGIDAARPEATPSAPTAPLAAIGLAVWQALGDAAVPAGDGRQPDVRS